MTAAFEDTLLIADALAYVVELYRELTQENGAPTPGTQNQAVYFILADPELSRSVRKWAEHAPIAEATTALPQRLPYDETYRRVKAFLRNTMGTPIFVREDHD